LTRKRAPSAGRGSLDGTGAFLLLLVVLADGGKISSLERDGGHDDSRRSSTRDREERVLRRHELVGDPVGDRQQAVTRCHNRISFLFRHNLSGHPLFQLASLVELARRQGDRPDFATGPTARSRSETGGRRVLMLKRAEQDAMLGLVLNNLLSRNSRSALLVS